MGKFVSMLRIGHKKGRADTSADMPAPIPPAIMVVSSVRSYRKAPQRPSNEPDGTTGDAPAIRPELAD
jgi:hypothetical protein